MKIKEVEGKDTSYYDSANACTYLSLHLLDDDKNATCPPVVPLWPSKFTQYPHACTAQVKYLLEGVTREVKEKSKYLLITWGSWGSIYEPDQENCFKLIQELFPDHDIPIDLWKEDIDWS